MSIPALRSQQFYFIVVTGVLLLLILLVLVAARWGAAGIYAWQGHTYIDRWIEMPANLNIDSWQNAHQNLERAVSLDTENSTYLNSMGVLYEWRSELNEFDFKAVQSDLIAALHWYQQALRYRPHSASSWANIAYVKSRLGQLDESFYRALSRASEYGKWEPNVLSRLLDAGLHLWPQMDREYRKLMTQVIQRSFVIEPEGTIKMLDQSGLKYRVCGALVRTSKVEAYCLNG